MTGTEIPSEVRELAAALGELFARDQQLAIELNDAGGRLRRANQRLWNGLHPDALGLIYDERAPAGGFPAEFISRSCVVPFDADAPLDRTEILRAVQQVHWAIQAAVTDYQDAAEQRRQLAADVGELTARLVAAMTAADFSEQQARRADISALRVGVLQVTS